MMLVTKQRCHYLMILFNNILLFAFAVVPIIWARIKFIHHKPIRNNDITLEHRIAAKPYFIVWNFLHWNIFHNFQYLYIFWNVYDDVNGNDISSKCIWLRWLNQMDFSFVAIGSHDIPFSAIGKSTERKTENWNILWNFMHNNYQMLHRIIRVHFIQYEISNVIGTAIRSD